MHDYERIRNVLPNLAKCSHSVFSINLIYINSIKCNTLLIDPITPILPLRNTPNSYTSVSFSLAFDDKSTLSRVDPI